MRYLAAILVLASFSFAAPAVTTVAPPYAADRKLADVEVARFDWTDAARRRRVPVKIYSPAALPAAKREPLPIIIFSHGLGGTRENYEYLGRQWAANGFVPVHLQHIGTDDSAWRGKAKPMEAMRGAISIQHAIDRADDVKFAIDRLTKLNADDPTWKGKLDLEHIAAAGHSFGAHTAMAVAGQAPSAGSPATSQPSPLRDPRVKAAIALSPNVPAIRANLDRVFATVKIPVFFITGTKDDSPLSDTKAAERRIPYDRTNNAPAAYLLILDGADHMTFSGRGAGKFLEQIQLASTAFFDAYLKDEAAAKKWLDDGEFAKELGPVGTFEHK